MRKQMIGVVVLWSSLAVRGQSELSFPQIAVGDSFETVVQVSNEVAVNDHVLLETFSGIFEGSHNGERLAVSFNGSEPSESLLLPMAPFEESSIKLTLEGSALRIGWLRVSSSAPGGKVGGSLFYRIWNGSQVIDSVGVTDAARYRFAQVQLDARDEGTDTGIAFANPDDEPVEILLDLFVGQEFHARFRHELGPREHFAKLITEIFPGSTATVGTLVIETSASRAIPFVTLRLDGRQLTSLPVRPFGFTLQFEVRTESGELVDTGHWVLESLGLNLVGAEHRSGTAPSAGDPVLGSWLGTSFQVYVRRSLDGQSGMRLFNGTSERSESSGGLPIRGKVADFGPNGTAVPVGDFIAFHKY